MHPYATSSLIRDFRNSLLQVFVGGSSQGRMTFWPCWHRSGLVPEASKELPVFVEAFASLAS